MWRDETVEESWQVLNELRNLADFVLIGGWAVYLWTHKLKSRDIDLCINQENFYKLQQELLQRNHALKRNVRLMKFEAIIDTVEVDIYTPFISKLTVPCLDILNNKLYSSIELFKVAQPEALILLKAQAAQQRWHSEKGVKDRIDIISLIKYADLKTDTIKRMSRNTTRNTRCETQSNEQYQKAEPNTDS
jgi:predicted nucleotidyltransferase